MKKIYLISDSTGELGDRFTNALLTQFPKDKIQFKKFNFVTDAEDARKCLAKITIGESVLFHTVIDRKLKRSIEALGKKRGVPTFDLTGPPTDFLITNLKARPVWNVSVVHQMDEKYNRRVEAIEYAIEHDDGAGNEHFKGADAVLVGPSRSSKTPTSMYLATKGYNIANIPLIRELGEPAALASLSGDKRVIGFVITPEKLCQMRIKRTHELGTVPKAYTDLPEIRKELIWVRRLYEKYRWKTIDVTDRAIEETAALIMKHIQNLSA